MPACHGTQVCTALSAGWIIECRSTDSLHGFCPALMSGLVCNMENSLMLQFSTADIDVHGKSPDIYEQIYKELIQYVDAKSIIGVQLIPRKWPRFGQILCGDKGTKELLRSRGLRLQNKDLVLHEPGPGVTKVTVEDAPLDMTNSDILAMLSKYGKVSEIRNEHLYVDGVRSSWLTGTRFAYMQSMDSPLPPTLKVKHGGFELKLTLRHFGQTHMECRWCHLQVPRDDHDCPRKPVRRCFNCGSSSHLKHECREPKTCYKCGNQSHIARDCPTNEDRPMEAEYPALNRSVASKTPVPTHIRFDDSPLNNLGPACEDSPEPRVIDNVLTHNKMDMILIGSSNCRDIQIRGDEDLEINTHPLIQGGLLINEAHEKLDELDTAVCETADAVVFHVGSCDFSMESMDELETTYSDYVQMLTTVSKRCPRAMRLISSIPPRLEPLSSETNSQIKTFNAKLQQLAQNVPNVLYIDNDACLTDAGQVSLSLYKDNDVSNIHLNGEGKRVLAGNMQDYLKDAYYKMKLASDYQILS